MARSAFVFFLSFFLAVASPLLYTVPAFAAEQEECDEAIGNAKLAVEVMGWAAADYRRAKAEGNKRAMEDAAKRYNLAHSDFRAAEREYAECGDFWKNLGMEEDELPRL